MAAQLPNGSIISMAATYGSPVTVTALSNATGAIATATGHTLANGDIVEITSGWSNLNGRIARVSASAAPLFTLESMDTSDVVQFPAGGGIGSVRKILTWVQTTQILKIGTTGGDQQFTKFQYLEADSESQLPTFKNAVALQYELADDDSLAGWQLAKASNGKLRAMSVVLKSGRKFYDNGIVGFGGVASMESNQVMTCKMDYALTAERTRYAS